MASGDTREQQYLGIAANGNRADLPTETCCETRTQTLTREVAERVISLDEEVQELKNNPDVVDIVDTYADLQNYDTQHLTDRDIIRVLNDETHSGDSTYYRYDKNTDTFTYIGESKQYSDFVGTDGTTAGIAGLVPAPTTTDVDKFLKSDGSWDTAGGGSSVTVVQTTGTSTTDVMSQNATTSLVYADPGTNTKIKIGDHTSESEGNNGIEIGHYSQATGSQAIAIGGGNSPIQAAKADSIRGIAIGAANCTVQDGISIGNSSGSGAGIGSIAIGSAATTGGGAGCVSIGAGSSSGVADTKGVVSIGFINPGEASSYGYNNSRHRLLTGVYDGQGIHDAATVAQGNTLATSAPTTSTVGVLGQLYTDTTTMHTYQCTDTTGGVYTWTQRW